MLIERGGPDVGHVTVPKVAMANGIAIKVLGDAKIIVAFLREPKISPVVNVNQIFWILLIYFI